MRRKFLKQVGLGILSIPMIPSLAIANNKTIEGMRKNQC